MISTDSSELLLGLDLDDLRDDLARRGIDRWSDAELVDAATAVVARPKRDPADSFVLHAPLELLARARLLRHVRAGDRDAARLRIAWLAATYEQAGESLPDPTLGRAGGPSVDDRDLDEIAAALAAAIGAGDLDAVDPLAAALGDRATPDELIRMIGPTVVPSLAAAAHGSILFQQLRAGEGDRPDRPGLLRGPARELARHPDWTLTWFESRPATTTAAQASGDVLFDAMAGLPTLGVPGSTFIYPLMHQVEATGLAAEHLTAPLGATNDAAVVARVLARVAAWSMLGEPDDHAPYGWTHCLTMPQAVLSLADGGVDPQVAAAIAATYVAGFRTALAARPLDIEGEPERPDVAGVTDAIALGREQAAAAAWHAGSESAATMATLAGFASRHHDAHLVKYTLACFDAAAADPSARPLYLAAAASLAAWWQRQPGDGLVQPR
jgi:hypothetical protein